MNSNIKKKKKYSPGQTKQLCRLIRCVSTVCNSRLYFFLTGSYKVPIRWTFLFLVVTESLGIGPGLKNPISATDELWELEQVTSPLVHRFLISKVPVTRVDEQEGSEAWSTNGRVCSRCPGSESSLGHTHRSAWLAVVGLPGMLPTGRTEFLSPWGR